MKVCGGKKGNYVKFRRVNEYLRDANAVGYEGRKEKVEVTVVPPEKKESFTKIVKHCNEYSSF